MNDFFFIAICAASVCLLLCAGFAAGFVYARRQGRENDPDAPQHLRVIAQRIDELIRRNALGLGSAREQLESLSRKTNARGILTKIDELIELNHHLERELELLRKTNKSSAKEERTNCDTKADVFARQQYQPKSNKADIASDFDLFLAELQENEQAGMPIEDLLGHVYERLSRFIPFQRMGYAEIDYEHDLVVSVWQRSDRPTKLNVGFSAPLSRSSLQFVAKQDRPRILDNLPRYLGKKNNSPSTRLLVREGFRSSLTFPINDGHKVVAFLFLTSVLVDGFAKEHLGLLRQTVDQIRPAVRPQLANS